MFRTTIAKSLFLCKRERPNIQLIVPLLCTRVKGPDKYTWKILIRMIKYLQEIRDYKLTLKINNTAMLDWYTDADFVVHENINFHMVGVITMGKGAIQKTSMKQKINKKSSTEKYLVAANDLL